MKQPIKNDIEGKMILAVKFKGHSRNIEKIFLEDDIVLESSYDYTTGDLSIIFYQETKK